MENNFSGYAKWSYEQLILRHPRARIEDFWKKGTHFFSPLLRNLWEKRLSIEIL
jgi:hypothetical protein